MKRSCTLLTAVLIGASALAAQMPERPLQAWAWWTRQVLAGAGFQKSMVQSKSGPQAVFTAGRGPVLVLLHGAGSQAGTWSQVAHGLTSAYTVVIPDLAGHGDSAPAAGPIQVAELYAALEAVVGPHARQGKVTVVGNSLGAWMALVLAHRHPEWVERVVAVNGGALKGSSGHAALLPQSREEARQTLALLMDPAAPPATDALLDDMVREAKDGPLARFAATAARMEAWVLTEPQLKALKVPVRFLWGRSDKLMPLAYAERHLAQLPDAKLAILERAGHLPQQEAALPFLEALRGILAEPKAGK